MVDDRGGNVVVAGAGKAVCAFPVADYRAYLGIQAVLLNRVDDGLEIGAAAGEQ